MDRERQLANVAFGGAWSEQIAGNERLAEAMECIEAAVIDCEEQDLRSDSAIKEALTVVAAAHPKGQLLSQAWEKGLSIGNAGLRKAELKRVADALRAGLGSRLLP